MSQITIIVPCCNESETVDIFNRVISIYINDAPLNYDKFYKIAEIDFLPYNSRIVAEKKPRKGDCF